MKICPRCKECAADGANFCPSCGFRLPEGESQPESPNIQLPTAGQEPAPGAVAVVEAPAPPKEKDCGGLAVSGLALAVVGLAFSPLCVFTLFISALGLIFSAVGLRGSHRRIGVAGVVLNALALLVAGGVLVYFLYFFEVPEILPVIGGGGTVTPSSSTVSEEPDEPREPEGPASSRAEAPSQPAATPEPTPAAEESSQAPVPSKEEPATGAKTGARMAPAALGETVEGRCNSALYGHAKYSISLSAIQRGVAAKQYVAAQGADVLPLGAGKEYVVATFVVANLQDLSGADAPFQVLPAQFAFADKSFAQVSQPVTAAVPGAGAALYEGARAEVKAVFEATPGEEAYAVFLEKVWFSLPTQ